MTTHDRPSQAEIEALSRELTDSLRQNSPYMKDLHQRAALMIARLERAWLEAEDQSDEYRERPLPNGDHPTRWRETD